jgi:YD repeat-containing protein
VTNFVARYECDLAAPADRVWQALTDPAELAAWFWPPSFGTAVTFEGTSWRIAAASPPMAASGTVLATTEPDRLVWSWRWDGEDLVTTVTIHLGPARAGCHLAIDHAGFPDQQARDDHVIGWRDCLARLQTRLAG